ncbi:hypothetical protein J6590_053527 [Homalodisca vitripennis]|nr:hypothetical protein J6590_053527 [Homalodisca vitripennis]
MSPKCVSQMVLVSRPPSVISHQRFRRDEPDITIIYHQLSVDRPSDTRWDYARHNTCRITGFAEVQLCIVG